MLTKPSPFGLRSVLIIFSALAWMMQRRGVSFHSISLPATNYSAMYSDTTFGSLIDILLPACCSLPCAVLESNVESLVPAL